VVNQAVKAKSQGLLLADEQKSQAARSNRFCFALLAAHAGGVNSLIWVILAAGKRVNKSLR
jgi:hypothetical protein